MAVNYDDVIRRNKRNLTRAQIRALSKAANRFSAENAGNRAGALSQLKEQYDTGYRGLQNMGLAGGVSSQATSGEVPRLGGKIETAFDQYNQKLNDVEHQRLKALGGAYAKATRRARYEAYKKRLAAEAARRAALEAAMREAKANQEKSASMHQTPVEARGLSGSTITSDIRRQRNVNMTDTGTGDKTPAPVYTSKKEAIAAAVQQQKAAQKEYQERMEAAYGASSDYQRAEQSALRRYQNAVDREARAKQRAYDTASAELIGVQTPKQQSDAQAAVKGLKAAEGRAPQDNGDMTGRVKGPSFKTQAQLDARAEVKRAEETLRQSKVVGYNTVADKQAYEQAEAKYKQSEQAMQTIKAKPGSTVNTKRTQNVDMTDAGSDIRNDYQTAQAKAAAQQFEQARYERDVAKLRYENPKLYAAYVVYNDPDSMGSDEWNVAVDKLTEDATTNLIKQAYKRDVKAGMTDEQYSSAQSDKDLPKIKQLLKAYDKAEKRLEKRKNSRGESEDSIAAAQDEVDSLVKDLADRGYTPETARKMVSGFNTERDARSEIEYYKPALKAELLYNGFKPENDVNGDETDPTYRAINNLPDIMRQQKNWWEFLPGAMSKSAFTDQSMSTGGVWGVYMNPDQRNAYNYLYETKGIEAANKYADDIRPLLNIQRSWQDAEYYAQLAQDDPIMSNIGSIIAQGAGSIPAAIEKLVIGGSNALSDIWNGGVNTPKYFDANSPLQSISDNVSTIRSETSRKILQDHADDPQLANLANRAYNIGMSIGDSAYNMAFGIAGPKWLTGLLASSSAANETYKEYREKGATQQQAMAMSGLSAVAEALFEEVSLEYFTNAWIEKGATWTKPFIVKWLLGMGVEGSEEVATATANKLSDVWVMKDKSEWKTDVEKKGMKAAFLDTLKDVGEEGLAGAISGGVFGLFGGAFNATINYSESIKIGKQAQSLGFTQKYKDMASVLGGEAEKLAAKADTKPTAHNIGRMVNQVNKQLSDVFTGDERTDIPMALLFKGDQLSFTDANAVFQALGSEKLEKMGYDADSARSFMESFNKRMVDSGVYSRFQSTAKERMANMGGAQADEYLGMTDQIAGTEYNEKNVKIQKAMREALENRVWKNPNPGTAVTDEGVEIPTMPGNMTRIGWAEMNRKNFKAQSTVTKGRTTYELSSMAMREGMSNEEAYSAMRDNLQAEARKSADFYEGLADSLGLDIVIHDVMRGSNGFLQDGKLHVVLSSRQNAVRIASHELTHYIKAHSPYKFANLQKNLICEVGAKEFDRMVAKKAAFYGFDANTASGLANAREEVCAELCERMLSNTDMLARFAQRDTATARTMKSHLEQTVAAIKRALTGNEEADFGKSDSGMIKAVNTMDSWIDGLTDAIANAEAQRRTMAGQVSVVAGTTVADQNALINDLKNAETEDEFDDAFAEHSVDIIEYDLAGYMQDLAKVMDAGEIQDLYETMTDAIREVKTHRSLLDFGEEYGSEEEILQAKKDRRYSPYKKNSDPHYKVALDFSTLCRKRVLLQAIQERLQAKLQRALSQEEIVAIRLELQKLQKENYRVEVACALCYVEAARLKTGANINKFLNNTEAEMKNYYAKKSETTKKLVADFQAKWKVDHNYAPNATKDQMSGADVEAFNEASRKFREKWGGSSEEEKRVIAKAVELAKEHPEVYLAQTQLDYLHKQNPNKYLSPAQLRELMTEYPDIFAALAEKVVSAARAKAQETDTFYSRGDIARVSASVIAAANLESGFRHQSWSDFVPKHLLDTMAAIIEMSTVKTTNKITNEEEIGAKMHAYTKVPSMVEFLGDTGMMLNMSLIPAGNGIDPVTGKLIWDSVEGMPWQTMYDLRKKFPNTAGNIAIGVSDEQIKLLLDSPDIDYVIPYHASGMNKNMREYLDIGDWSEFTRSQNEKGDKKQIPGLNDWFDAEEAAKAKDGYEFMRQASKKYLQLCADRGLTPKFAKYLKKNSNGSYSLRDDYQNYWKLLIDRKMVNQVTGKVIIQQAVKPKFNKDTVMRVLRDPVNETLSNHAEKAANEVTARFSNWVANKNNASAAAIAETKEILKDLEKNGPVVHSIDAEDESGYNEGGYRAYMTPESIERYSKDPRFAKYKYKDLAFIPAASFNGVNFPSDVLMSIPKIAEAQRNIEQQREDTLTQYPIGESPKRDALRRTLVERMLGDEYGSAVFENGRLKKIGKKGDYSGPVARERYAAIVIGRPAGGKSTVYADPLSNELKARIMDSDTIKEWLPEYADGDGASVVHEESSEILKAAMEKAIARGENLIIPKIGGPSIEKLARKLKDAGYKLGLYDNEISQETSVTRSASRFVSTGRWIDMNYLLSIGDKPINTFRQLAESGLFDYAEIRSNEAPGLDAVPQEIWKTGSAESLDDAIQRYYSELGRPAAGNASAAGGYGLRDGQSGRGVQEAVRKGSDERLTSASHSLDDEYMDLAERYAAGIASDEEARQLQDMVNKRAEAVRAQVFAATDVPTYSVRRGPKPKKTIKVYKTFTLTADGQPSALFVSSQYALPIGVWLDAKDTYHFQDSKNGHWYVPSTKNPNTKGGATGRPTLLKNISEQQLRELEERGYITKADGKYRYDVNLSKASKADMQQLIALGIVAEGQRSYVVNETALENIDDTIIDAVNELVKDGLVKKSKDGKYSISKKMLESISEEDAARLVELDLISDKGRKLSLENGKGVVRVGNSRVASIDAYTFADLERRGLISKQHGGEYAASTLTSLAYRPGWHAGDLPFFPQGGMKIGNTNYENIHRYNQVVFECEMDMDHDFTTYDIGDDGSVRYKDMQQMPTGGGYKFATNPMAKASDIGAWYISDSLKIIRALSESEANEILSKEGRAPQEWQAYQDEAELKNIKGDKNKSAYEKRIGPLDLDKLGYDPTRTSENMKLLDPVTYDDNGNIIPLSQRFNAEVKDPRYSIDDESTYDQYSPEAIEQLDGVSEFLDRISGGDAQLRDKLITALMPVIEEKVTAAQKRATNPVQTAQTKREPGMKPAGKEPRVRDVRVPQYAKTGNPVSDFVRSFLESDKATDQMVADLQDKIANGEWGSYTRLTNAEAMAQAQDFISRRTLSKAQTEFHDMVKSGRYNVQTRAIGLQLLAEAAKRGDSEAVLNIATDLRELATDAGQSVQIFSALKELGGVGSAWYMQKKIDALNAKYAAEIAAGKMNEIVVDAGLMQDLIEAKTTAEIEDAEDEIAKEIAKQLPLTWESRISNWRYMAMLANPTTHFRNIAGNVFMAALNTTKDAVATGIERLAVRDQSKRAHALLTLNDKKTWGAFADTSYAAQEKVLRGSGKFGFESQLRQYMRAFDTKWLNKIAQFNFDKLESEDMKFIKPAYRNALMQYMIAQGYTIRDGVAGKMVNGEFKEISKDQMNAAQEWASQQAWKATFHDASKLATILNEASRKLGPVGNVLIEGVMPFKKTPINIAKRGVEYSPAGIVMGMLQLSKDVRTGKVTTAQAIDNIASGITGTTLMAVGALLAKMGLIRGAGEDKKKHETYLSDTGDQTYALKLGKMSIGISALAPATIPLFMGVALYESLDKNGEGIDASALVNTVANTLNPFMDMSFMSSLNSALKSYNNNGIGGALGNMLLTTAESYGSQFLPTVVGKAGQVFDPIARSTKSSAASPIGSHLDYYGRSLAKKVPGLEATLQPDVNVWGKTTNTMDSFGTWALDFANKFIFPANVSFSNKDEVDNELIRLVESTGNVNILPSDGDKSFKVNGESFPMTAAQYTQFSKDRGQASYAAIKEVMLSNEYKTATDEARASMLQNALEAAQKQVNTVWKEKLGALQPTEAEGIKGMQGDYSDPALYKVAASYPNAYDKAAKAKAQGISPDTFLSLYDQKETYVGDERARYMRQQIMDSDLTPKQKELMDSMLISENGTKPDYSDQAMFNLSMKGKSAYEKGLAAKEKGVSIETYTDLYDKKSEYAGEDKSAYLRREIMSSDLTVEQKKAMDDLLVSDKGEDPDYSDSDLFELSLTNRPAYNKAKTAKAKGVSVKNFTGLLEKKNSYSGEDKADYMRGEIMKMNLTTSQKELMDDLLVSDKGRNPDYSSPAWFEISMLGSSQYKDAKGGEKIGLKPETYLDVYKKWQTIDAKNKKGKTVNGLKKKRAKQYLDSLTITAPVYDYIWHNIFGYKRK